MTRAANTLEAGWNSTGDATVSVAIVGCAIVKGAIFKGTFVGSHCPQRA